MVNLLLLHELLNWLKFYQLLKNDQRRGIGIIYERNGRLSEKIELVPKMIVRHMPSILSVLTDGSCTLFLNFSSFVRRDRDPRENSEKDVQGGVRRSDPIPARLQAAPIVPRDVSNLRRSYKIEESWCERPQRRSRRPVDAGRVVRRTDLLLRQHCRSVPFVSYLKFIFDEW